MNKIYILIIIIASFLTSCMSIKYTDIEVLIPSDVEYPADVVNVVLVNNAAEQPAHIGHSNYVNKLYRRGKKMFNLEQDTVALDSTGFTCLFNTANQLKAAEFFQNIYVHPKSLNESPYYYFEQKLKNAEIQQLLDDYQTDVIISLEKLNYESKLTIREVAEEYYDYATIDVNFTAVWRIYYGDQFRKTQRIELKDTIFWESEHEENYLRLLPKAEAVTEALWVAGELSGKKLAPHWDKVQRLYYDGGNTYFKLADRYYKDGKWNSAEEVWEYIYLTYHKQKKARAAVNLAYINELNGELHASLQWLEKAISAYKETSYAYNDEYKMILQYKQILKKRKADEDLLIRQFDVD